MDTSIIAGRNSVTEALKAGRSVTKIYMTAKKEAPPLARIRTLAKERKIPVEFVDTRAMERLAQGVRHQDVIALLQLLTLPIWMMSWPRFRKRERCPFWFLPTALKTSTIWVLSFVRLNVPAYMPFWCRKGTAPL